MHMMEIGGCELGTAVFEFLDYMHERKRSYTLYMREWGGTWKFGDFMESILCQCDVANCVNCFAYDRVLVGMFCGAN